jgi:hypothetical protein
MAALAYWAGGGWFLKFVIAIYGAIVYNISKKGVV